ncbi:MAG: double-stranded DNA repair protein Rad50 [Gemmatimonadales bacterium]|nr:MAG: double-stranded DNA repair protein Rad50 [Gemmatimonadales bacterium]
MQIHRLKLVNFRQHADTEIVLGPGITGIIGPNGSGKTTLLEAIAWAFYGNPAARGTRDSIRRIQAPPRSQVRVEVEFSLGAHHYRVVRGLYQAELYQDGSPSPLADSQQEVTAKLQRLFGMSREEFFSTYFTGQKELTVMANLGPTDRGRFLSKILGYEKLRAAQEVVRSRKAQLRSEREGLERGLPSQEELERERTDAVKRVEEAREWYESAQRELAQAEAALESEKPGWERMVALRESILALEGERKVAEQHVQEARRECERIDRELADALAAQAKLKELEAVLSEVAALKQEEERLEREARAAGQRRALAGQRREIEHQLSRLKERLGEMAGAEAFLERAGRVLAESQAALEKAQAEEEQLRTAWVRDRQDAETKRQALRDQYREVSAHRESILAAGPAGKCPTCLRPLGEEYQAVLETLERQLEEIELNGKFFRQRVQQLADPPAELREAERRRERAQREVEKALEEVTRARERVRELKELEAECRELESRAAELDREIGRLPETYDAERHQAVRARLRELEPAVSAAERLRVRAESADRLVAEAEAAERRLSERESRLAELARAIQDAGYSEERFAEARSRYEAVAARVRQAELAAARAEGDRKVAEESLRNVERRIKDRQERLARLRELDAELALHEELDRGFHEVRTALNAQMRPELSELASSFLADLTEGRYTELELDEDYNILIVEEGRAKPVLSGGEEDIANLVLRLAISQMVAERAGQPLSLLVLDEVFGSLDERRQDQVLSLLRGLADRFPQVILITHVESVREGLDRILRVSFDPGRGTAVVSEEREFAPHGNVAA